MIACVTWRQVNDLHYNKNNDRTQNVTMINVYTRKTFTFQSATRVTETYNALSDISIEMQSLAQTKYSYIIL